MSRYNAVEPVSGRHSALKVCQYLPACRVKMLLEGRNRTPEQRTLNPRVRSRLAVGFIAIAPWSGCCRPFHAAGRTAQIAPALPRPAAQPVSHVPCARQESDPRSPLLGTMQNIRRPGHAKSRPQVHRSYTPGQPQTRADPAWPSMRHAQRGARHSGPRPRNGNRMRCRHDSRTAAGGTTRRQPPRGARAREFPEIHPPA